MSDKKISELTDGGAAVATDEFVVARSSDNRKILATNVAAAATRVGTLQSLDVFGATTLGGTLSVAGVATLASAPIVSALTASQAIFTDSAKQLISVSLTGTGNVVMSASPTLSGTVTMANLAMSGTLAIAGLTYTFPSAQTANRFLKTDGNGNLSWSTLTDTLLLSSLNDVTITSLASGQFLSYNGTAWVNTVSGASLTNLNANNLASGTVPTARVSGSYTGIIGLGTVTAGVWNASPISDTYLATISTAGKVANSATTATTANTANTIVARDASGGFTAGTITATLTGNASTASALQTARTINGVGFDGTANITVTASASTLTGTTLASNVVSSSLTSVGTLSALTVSGNLVVDTNTLYVDATANKIGVNTSTLTAVMNLYSATAGAEVLRVEGKYGTGSTTLANFLREGGLVAAAIVYNNTAPISINFGTTTAHPLNLLTSNTVRVSIDAAGAVSMFGTLSVTGAITGSLTGNADTATKLSSARAFTLSGDVTGTVNSDLLTGATITTTLATVTVAKGGTGATTASAARTNLGVAIGTDVQAWDADLDAIGALAGTSGLLRKTASNTWILDTNTYLTSASSITISGDASGSGTSTITLTLASVNTAGTYTKVTTDAKGRVTSGTTLSASDIPTLTASKISDFDTQVRTSRLDQLAAPTAAVSFNAQRISNLADPTNAQDAATKAYVDSISLGLDVKASVRVAAATNVSLSAPGASIDGITLASGDRVLLFGQTTGSQNGIYVWTGAAVTMTRASDADTSSKVTPGLFTFVEQGTYADAGFVLTTDSPITLGTTALTFAQFSGAGQITAGTGLTKSGNTLSITNTTVTAASYGSASSVPTFTVNAQGQLTTAANVAIAIAAAAVSGLAASATTDTTNAANISLGTLPAARLSGSYTGITGLGTITAGTWTATAVDIAYGGTGGTTAATARTNLGLAIGTNVQAWDADLDAIAALAGTSGFLKKTAANTWALDTNTYLTGNQTVTVSGDAAGSGTTAITLTLSTVNSNVGTFGAASTIPILTVNAKGLVTAVSTAAVVAPAGTLSGTALASNVVSSSLTSLGTLSALAVSGTTTLNGVAYTWPVAGGTSGQVLTSNGTGGLSWTTVSGAGSLSGSGTTNAIPRFTGAQALGDSGLSDDGTQIIASRMLQLVTGTATVAPIKFLAGTNLTTPVAGVMEWNGTNLFITQATGPTRKTLAFTDSNITGTAANVSGTVAVANGGTGATDAATARTNLGLAIGTNVQAWDADLDAIAALSGTTGFLKKTAANTWALDTNTYLTGNQSITLSGDATGSGTTAITVTLANSGVTAGTYTKVTVDAKGRVTSGTTLSATDIPTLTASKISDFDTQVRTSRLDQLAAPTAAVSLNSQRITNLLDPTSAQDAATKAYVDATLQGLDVKASVRAATTAAITTLAGGAPNTLDGVTLAANDRILVKDQATASQNGLYAVQTLGTGSNGTWVRATDADTTAKVTAGLFVFVEEGTTNGDSGWVLTTNNPIVLGTSSLAFAQFSGAGQITAGTGLTKSANTLSITNTGVTAGSYGSASVLVTLTVNAQGQLTAVSNATIAITSSQVSGLATSATTDTTNASNISSGTLAAARLPAFTGDATSTAGSAALTLANSGVTAGTYTKVTVDAKGRVTSGTTLSSGDIPSLSYLPLSGGTLTGVVLSTNNQNVDGSNFAVDTSTKSTALYAYDVRRSGSSVGGITIAGVGVFASGTTIAGNVALHAGNFNTYSPSLSGVGASGTWNINVTGNANNITQYTVNQSVGTGNVPTFSGLAIGGLLSLASPAGNGISGAINSVWGTLLPPGRKLFPDDQFASGSNSINIYNNSGGSAVTHTRKNSAFADGHSNPPNATGYVIEILHAATTSLGSSPGNGGWHFGVVPGGPNRRLLCVFKMKIPTGRSVIFASNSMGTGGGSTWLTSTAGTGLYQDYAVMVHSGPSPSSTMFFYIDGDSSTFYTYLASATVYDTTDVSNQVWQTVTARNSAAQDSVTLQGRAGGSSNYTVNITPTTLSATRTLTLADGDTTLVPGTMLPTSGGTITGNLYLSANSQGANGNSTLRVNGDITAARGNGTSGVIYLGNSGSSYVYYDGANYFMPSGQLDVNGSRVLHAGNYTSYAPSLTGSGASGTWGINITGNAATVTNGFYTSGGTISGATTISYNNGTIGSAVPTYSASNLQIHTTSNNTPTISFHRSGVSATALYEYDGQLYVNAWTTRAQTGLLLSSGNYNSYAPSLSGTGASGTWGINISGRAASMFYTPTTSGTLDWNDVSNTRPGAGATLLLGGATNGPGPGSYYHPVNFEYSSNDGTGNVTQLAIAYGSPGNDLWMRGRYGGSWTSWVRYLNTGNLNSYAPTLTGTGASGTWGISITGNAATASTSSQVTINYSNDSNSTYQILWGSGNSVYGTAGFYINPAIDYVYGVSFNASDWFRSSGSTGWYNGDYGGGMYMQDTTWVRVYNAKAFYVANQIAATGDVTAYYSDERLKTKTGVISNALDKVRRLKGFLYTENELARSLGYTNTKQQVGVSAQEVQAVLPEAVALAPVDMHTDPVTGQISSKSGEDYLTVRYERLVPLLIEAIKELAEEVRQLREDAKK